MMFERDSVGKYMIVSDVAWDREGLGDGTRKSRHCAAHCVLYASLVFHGKTDGVLVSSSVVRDTPMASSTVQTWVDSKRMSGLQATAATGLCVADSSSVAGPVTAHEGSIVTWWRGNGR